MLVHVRQQFYTKRYAHEEKENKLKINQRMRGCVIASFPLPFYITFVWKMQGHAPLDSRWSSHLREHPRMLGRRASVAADYPGRV